MLAWILGKCPLRCLGVPQGFVPGDALGPCLLCSPLLILRPHRTPCRLTPSHCTRASAIKTSCVSVCLQSRGTGQTPREIFGDFLINPREKPMAIPENLWETLGGEPGSPPGNFSNIFKGFPRDCVKLPQEVWAWSVFPQVLAWIPGK